MATCKASICMGRQCAPICIIDRHYSIGARSHSGKCTAVHKLSLQINQKQRLCAAKQTTASTACLSKLHFSLDQRHTTNAPPKSAIEDVRGSKLTCHYQNGPLPLVVGVASGTTVRSASQQVNGQCCQVEWRWSGQCNLVCGIAPQTLQQRVLANKFPFC